MCISLLGEFEGVNVLLVNAGAICTHWKMGVVFWVKYARMPYIQQGYIPCSAEHQCVSQVKHDFEFEKSKSGYHVVFFCCRNIVLIHLLIFKKRGLLYIGCYYYVVCECSSKSSSALRLVHIQGQKYSRRRQHSNEATLFIGVNLFLSSILASVLLGQGNGGG